MKRLDNLMTVATIKGTIQDHASHFADLAAILQSDPDPDANLKSRQKLAEIRMILAKANQDFQQGKYQRALEGYRRLQGLVYGLIHPRFNPDVALNPGFRAPMAAALFGLMMRSSLDMVEKIAPSGIWASFDGATLSLPADVRKEMAPFAALGVNAETGLAPEVSEAAMVGADYMANKQWSKATEFFRLGLKAVGNGGDAAALAAKASLEMNLGVALLQSGQLDQAQRQFTQAAESFEASGDTVGQSQALTNQAAALAKTGKADDAGKALDQAEALLVKAGGKIEVKRPAAAPRPLPLAPALRAPTTSAGALSGAIDAAGNAVVLRLPGASDGWVVQNLATVVENKAAITQKSLAAQLGGTRLDLKWEADGRIDANAVVNALYAKRTDSADLGLVNFRYDLDSDFALRLPHLYYFSLPVKIGDCYRELGQYDAAEQSYRDAAGYQFINRAVEMPALWLRLAETALAAGDLLYRQGDPVPAIDVYAKVMTLEEAIPAAAFLYAGPLKLFGDTVAPVVADLDNAAGSALNPRLIGILLDIRTRLRMIKAGLNFWGISANYFPIFKFDYLQTVATHFAQLAVQAEREYINFTARGEDEELTRQQIEQSVETARAEVDLAAEQLEYAQAEVDVAQEALELAALRRANAQQQRVDTANAAYEIAALDAATQFAAGPEGYSVSYSYYSPSEGKTVTLEGSDAYKVMADAAFRRGMVSRGLELANLDRQIAEFQQNQNLAQAQKDAADARVDVAQQQVAIAEMHQRHAEDLLESFDDQTFTPEVWFQLGAHMRWISASYMQRALAVAHKAQLAYELETGFRLSVIKDSYNTNIVSGLLSADYLLRDIEYFTFRRIMQSKAKDVPLKQGFSLSSLNPTAFATTFKQTGVLEFDLSLADFDRAYPGSYMRKIKKVEVVVEGLLPPGGVHGSLKNAGVSRDRRKNGDVFFRLQPRETLFLSQYTPRADISIFQPDPKVLDVFELCGVATGWTLEIPPFANDINYDTISDVRMIVYYTAQHDPLLETQIRNALPKAAAESVAIPFRILLPDAYFAFLDTGEMRFDLRAPDFAYNQTNPKVREAAIRVVRQDGADPSGITLAVGTGGAEGQDVTDANGSVRSDPAAAAPLNALRGLPVIAEWHVAAPEAANPGFDRAIVRDLFLFLEYDFDYRGL